MIINYTDYRKIQEMRSKGFNTCQNQKKLGYTNYIIYKLWVKNMKSKNGNHQKDSITSKQ